MENTLYYGDNLEILRRYIPNESVDLVYLDPPFNSNATYNLLFAEENGSRAASQIRAFGDTWTWTQESEAVYSELVTKGGKVSDCLQAFRTFLGPCNMLAYLVMMAPRLVELRRVMNQPASIYLHCDPTASHYLKMLLDAVFGPKNFKNEIIWQRLFGGKSDSGQYGRNSDRILFYTTSEKYYFSPPRLSSHKEKTILDWYNKEDKIGPYVSRPLTAAGSTGGDSGKPWRDRAPTGHWTVPRILQQRYEKETNQKLRGTVRERLDILADAGYIDFSSSGNPSWRRYLHEAETPRIHDIWADDDVRPINRISAERLGYPTQKPEALLERIIIASSRESDLVLDPFCGCGTTIAAAQKLGRRWIGIDITHLAITLIKNRLADTFGNQVSFKVVGEPVSVPDAKALASSDPYQFQWWALGLIGARPIEEKKGADKGVDGKIIFQGDAPGKFEQVIISVKAGHITANHVRDLRGVIEREKAAIGVLISMEDFTKPMRTEAVTAGFFESKIWGRKYPKVQLLTVAELLAGKKVDMPPIRQVGATFKKAERYKGQIGEQLEIKERDSK